MLGKVKFATKNKDKLAEAKRILGIDMQAATFDDLDEIQEIQVDKIIEHKAKQAYDNVKEPVIVEDTGLFFNGWNGFPGALIKWLLESVDNEGIVKMLEGFSDRSAVAECHIGLYDGKRLILAKGIVQGRVAESVRGKEGFGWDRIFIPEGHDRTFGEMSKEEKDAISHRKLAFEDLKNKLHQQGLID